MIVVSNASPLIYLGKLGQLGLLHKQYGQILISGEVYNEVVVNGLRMGALDATAVDVLVKQGLIQVVTLDFPDPIPDWVNAIDLGEAETILLAQQRPADLAIIDNHHARMAARHLGLSIKGTIGVLLSAFREGHLSIDEFEWVIGIIKSRPEIWISDRLCDLAMAQAKSFHP